MLIGSFNHKLYVPHRERCTIRCTKYSNTRLVNKLKRVALRTSSHELGVECISTSAPAASCAVCTPARRTSVAQPSAEPSMMGTSASKPSEDRPLGWHSDYNLCRKLRCGYADCKPLTLQRKTNVPLPPSTSMRALCTPQHSRAASRCSVPQMAVLSSPSTVHQRCPSWSLLTSASNLVSPAFPMEGCTASSETKLKSSVTQWDTQVEVINHKVDVPAARRTKPSTSPPCLLVSMMLLLHVGSMWSDRLVRSKLLHVVQECAHKVSALHSLQTPVRRESW